jgi:transposase
MQEVADRFAVKRGWVNEIMQRYNQTGSVAASPRGGGATAKLIDEDYQVIAEIIKHQNDAYVSRNRGTVGRTDSSSSQPAHNVSSITKNGVKSEKKLCTLTNETQRQYGSYAWNINCCFGQLKPIT